VEICTPLLPQNRQRLQAQMAWIAGMLAQAADPEAAARTRPFVVNSARLAELYPEQQQASVDRLVDQLAAVVRSGKKWSLPVRR